MSEIKNPPHEEWLKTTCPQVYKAIQPPKGISEDSEDLKSCAVRLEQENTELKAVNASLNEKIDNWMDRDLSELKKLEKENAAWQVIEDNIGRHIQQYIALVKKAVRNE
jgi:hypothetical protein